MLNRNENAISIAREMGTAELKEKLSCIRDYDDSISPLDAARDAERIVISLRNEDRDGMLGILFTENAEGVAAGALAVSRILGIGNICAAVRSEEQKEALLKAAEKAGICFDPAETTDLTDVRSFENAVFMHPAYLAACADTLCGLVPGVILAEEGAEPAEYPFGSPWLSVVSAGKKAYRIGNRFYTDELCDSPILPNFHFGSGVIHPVTEESCMVKETAGCLHDLRADSCGKCTFCREGLFQLESIFNDATRGRSKAKDTELVRELTGSMSVLNNCSLGLNAANIAESLLDHFPDEVNEHMNKRYCRSGSCSAYADEDPSAESEVAAAAETVLSDEDKAKRQSLKRKARKMAKAVIRSAAPEKSAAAEKTAERGKGPLKKLETDIVIIAGGPAGLAAAVAAGENGARTILLDKSNTVGGAANMGMGPLGIGTTVQKANFNDITVEYALKKHMEYTHYRVDEDLVSAYFHKSADTIAWLQDMGVEFFGAFRYFKESEATWHIVKSDNGVIGPRAAGKMARILAEKAREQGTQIMLETAGVDLIKEDDRVAGAIAVGADGTEYEIRAKAVIVATGGFIGNKQMVEEEFGLHLQEDFFPFHMPGLQGDGLKMMWKAGAAKYGLNIEAIYQVPDNSTWAVLDGVLRQPNLLINQFGERFMDEGDMGNTTYTGNAIALQPGNYAYCIMDRAILKSYQKNGPDIVDLVHPSSVFFEFDEVAQKAVEQDYMGYAEGETVAELAEKIGIDPEILQMTIDEYNEMCRTGLDSRFHKKRAFLHPITGKGGYICGKFYLGAYGTIGGVRINRYCEVLDENQIPIEGLYAAGTDANTIYGDSYNFTLPGNSMGFAVNTGRMAGESAARFIKEI